jgi:hypothetical protein
MNNTGNSAIERRRGMRALYLLPFTGKRRGDRVKTVAEMALLLLIAGVLFFAVGCKRATGGSEPVAAPQAYPPAGEVVGGTKIVIFSPTTGADIYYTVDGS